MALDFRIKKIGSSGFLFFVLSFFRHKYRIIGCLTAVLLFMLMSQLSWGVMIEGSREKITQDLMMKINDYEIGIGSRLKKENEIVELQKKMQEDFSQDIDWLNLYLDGHVYSIRYTPKIISEVEKPSYSILVASDDAVIEKIEVSKGNVLVKRNQHVKKGDILVSNEIIGTNNEVKLVETKGKVFGYIYKTYEASVISDDLAESFVLLHLHILDRVKQEIGEDGEISQENVLQYERKEGKITLKVQFTLYKNIAQKEIVNEQ